ncbi:hypothetical protein AB0E59_41160 [Lentzea sp. NPDC034063]|uniref:hypothetical protein n=1 Tax=unclassified Lentzea TaxID=2643253 RepID=UPI0033CEC3FF
MQPALSVAVVSAAAWYRERLFWPVGVAGDAVLLPLGCGVVAFEVPLDRAARVREALEHNGTRTAALFTRSPDKRVTFLAEADGAVFGQHQMPFGVRYLTVPVSLRLPLLVASASRGASWFCAPDPAHRWFPCAAAVLAAVTAATPFALRAATARPARPSRERLLIG